MELVSGVILVGGKSRRMGFNKAFLKLGRQTLLSKIASELKKVFTTVFLVGSDPEPYRSLGLPVVTDLFPHRGPLAGIHAALVYAQTPYIFVAACDLPFLRARLAAYLAAQAPGWDIVVPRIDGFSEPLCAVYGRNCLPASEEALRKEQPKLTAFFPAVRVKYIEREELQRITNVELAFLNLNTPKDIGKAILRTKPG